MGTAYVKFTEDRNSEENIFLAGRIFELTEASANYWVIRNLAIYSTKREFEYQASADEEAAAQTAADKKAAEEAEEKKAKEAAAQTAADKKAVVKNADTDAKANK